VFIFLNLKLGHLIIKHFDRYKFGGTFADTIYCKDYNYNLNPPKCILSQYKCDESHLITKQKSCPSGYKYT